MASTLTTGLTRGIPARDRSVEIDEERDDVLVDLYSQGVAEAFNTIHKRYRPLVFSVGLRILRSREDAEDVTQEIFAIVATKLNDQFQPENLKAWLVGLTRNRSIDVIRRRRDTADLSSIAEPAVESAQTASENREELAEVLLNIQELPELQRKALLLREAAGYSYNDVSKTLGIKLSAVRDLIKRARITLRGQNEAEGTCCNDIREKLAERRDRRARNNEIRFHLRRCSGCRDFDSGLNRDSRAIRALFPAGALAFGADDAFADEMSGSTAHSHTPRRLRSRLDASRRIRRYSWFCGPVAVSVAALLVFASAIAGGENPSRIKDGLTLAVASDGPQATELLTADNRNSLKKGTNHGPVKAGKNALASELNQSGSGENASTDGATQPAGSSNSDKSIHSKSKTSDGSSATSSDRTASKKHAAGGSVSSSRSSSSVGGSSASGQSTSSNSSSTSSSSSSSKAVVSSDNPSASTDSSSSSTAPCGAAYGTACSGSSSGSDATDVTVPDPPSTPADHALDVLKRITSPSPLERGAR